MASAQHRRPRPPRGKKLAKNSKRSLDGTGKLSDPELLAILLRTGSRGVNLSLDKLNLYVHNNVHMETLSKYITATEARKNLFDLINLANKRVEPIEITVNGVPAAVMMSKSDYDAWMATYETLADSDLMIELRQSEKDFKAGRYTTLDKLQKELKLDDFIVADKGKRGYVSDRVNTSRQQRVKKA